MSDTVERTIESLHAALAAAEARATRAEERNTALEAQICRAEQDGRVLLEQERFARQRLDDFVANVPGIVWENYFKEDPELGRLNYVSANAELVLGYSVAEWGEPDFWVKILVPEDQQDASVESQRILTEGSGTSVFRWVRKDGRTVWMTSRISTIRDQGGVSIGMRGVTLDVTDLKRTEAERNAAQLREERLRAQEDSLLALSTPLVPIDDDLLTMPLIGRLDERRAERVLTALLEGVARTGAQTVILDVTGVPEVDGRTADALVRAARAVSLLGAEVVLTGIRAEVARTLVTIGSDLGSIMMKGTLKAGIAYALKKKNAPHGRV